MENPNPAELDRKDMGEAILLQEKFAYHLHSRQRMEELEKAPLHERVASILSTMNQSLSVVDENREVAIAMHTQHLLRNSRVKSELANFLMLQAQIQRVASLTRIIGRVDEEISKRLDPACKDPLNINQLLTLQRSAHTQLSEITDYIRETRTDGLEGLMKTLVPAADSQIASTIETISKLDPRGREHVHTLIRTLLVKAASTPNNEEVVPTDVAIIKTNEVQGTNGKPT